MDISEEEKNLIRQKVEKLKNSKFKQQTLPAWRPIPSFRSTMITFTVFGIIFLGLGVLLYIMSDQIKEIVVTNYDDLDQCKAKDSCTIEFKVTENIQQPIYVYYQLDNFYQNHRRYVKSRSFNQLKGDYLTVDKLADCDPIKKNSDVGRTLAWDKNTTLKGDDPAIPCGLVAKSFFNDTYVLLDPNGNPIDINQKNIAWESDKEYKFFNTKQEQLPAGITRWDQIQWMDMTDGKYHPTLIHVFSRALHRLDEDGRPA